MPVFVEGMAMVDDNHSIAAVEVDITLMKAKGSVWHKSSMKKGGVVPRHGIDTDARWRDYSQTNEGWIFGYKKHLTCTKGEIVIPLTVDVTTTNDPDSRMYIPLTSSSSSVFSLPYLLYIIVDPDYDDKKLYTYIKKALEIDLAYPVERYKSTSKDSLDIVCFYESVSVDPPIIREEYLLSRW
ncbi:MAG TPA: hypothetical protein VN703_02220 [Candidatus Sulfopaludibacter sp.]|jgi:hypothetical protein|nr:hypothetical protein [Candidatus Sulfopaludibacter sp.]